MGWDALVSARFYLMFQQFIQQGIEFRIFSLDTVFNDSLRIDNCFGGASITYFPFKSDSLYMFPFVPASCFLQQRI